MEKQEPKGPRHAERDCACDRCWKPSPENEQRAAEWWRDLYARLKWSKDDD